MDNTMDNEPIKVRNPQEEQAQGNPIFEEKPDLGDEKRVAEITETNQEMDKALGFDPAEGDLEPAINDMSSPEHSIDEQMPAGSESPEDKAQDIINSGILRI